MEIESSVLNHDAGFLHLDEGAKDFKDQWLEEKYYFCGGSVRYMFALNISVSKHSIDEALRHEIDVEKLLGNEESLASSSVGNIRQRVNQKYFLLSQYVMRSLFERQKATDSIIAMIKSRAKEIGNNALKGWAHEMQMLVYLQQCVNKGSGTKTFKMMLQDDDGIVQEELILKFEEEYKFINEGDIVQTLNSDKVLLLPKKFNQGCYDAVVALLKNHKTNGQDVLLVLQATVGKDHSFKQSFLTSLILQLANNTIEENQRDNEDQGSKQRAKRLRTEVTNMHVLVSKLSIWHCFVLETAKQLENFSLPLAEIVGVRSSKAERKWEIKPTFFKVLLTAPQ